MHKDKCMPTNNLTQPEEGEGAQYLQENSTVQTLTILQLFILLKSTSHKGHLISCCILFPFCKNTDEPGIRLGHHRTVARVQRSTNLFIQLGFQSMSSSGSLKVVIKTSSPTSPVALRLSGREIKRCLPFRETQTKLMVCCEGPLYCTLPNGPNVCLSFPSAPSRKAENKRQKRAKSDEQWGSVCEEEDHCHLEGPLCANMLIVQMSQSSFHILLVECSISEQTNQGLY